MTASASSSSRNVLQTARRGGTPSGPGFVVVVAGHHRATATKAMVKLAMAGPPRPAANGRAGRRSHLCGHRSIERAASWKPDGPGTTTTTTGERAIQRDRPGQPLSPPLGTSVGSISSRVRWRPTEWLALGQGHFSCAACSVLAFHCRHVHIICPASVLCG